MSDDSTISTILDFLERVGIAFRAGDPGQDPFLPGIAFRAGAIVFDPHRLEWPGDLLH